MHVYSVIETHDCHGNSCGDNKTHSTDTQFISQLHTEIPGIHFSCEAWCNFQLRFPSTHLFTMRLCHPAQSHIGTFQAYPLAPANCMTHLQTRHQVISVATGHPGGTPVTHPASNNIFLLERKAWCCTYTECVNMSTYERGAMSTKLSPLPTPAVYRYITDLMILFLGSGSDHVDFWGRIVDVHAPYNTWVQSLFL